ncbi:MAG TPA: hypothetical protein DCR14_06890, partial [Acidimicrobiaceae bacterium]|nr:hypothetical protein [Acidimicrobiaceae bacterium]
MLPPAYAVLHDVMVPGSATGVDHMVVGPGGSFLVMSRRYAEAIAYRDGQLWAGQVSLRHDVEEARLEAQRLTHIVGSPVVPLVAFLQAVMPAAAPRAIDGVLVTGGDTVVRVITRASHTLLTSPQVADVVERALPLLHSPGSVVRSVSSKGVPRDPQPDPSVHPTMPAQATSVARVAALHVR